MSFIKFKIKMEVNVNILANSIFLESGSSFITLGTARMTE